MAKSLMIQGTGSNVGKSLLVAGFCRYLTNQGYKVRPFKPQNMSNNAAVCDDGGEVGRAQALQALAAKTPLTSDMNPVLLKPQSQIGSQLIVGGKVKGNYDAKAYQEVKKSLLGTVMNAFHRLKKQADFVIVEGAGSASEVNLRENDIANMGFALKADLPVILAADISRGGVIASLVGAHKLMSEDEKKLTKGYIINRFMGDQSIFYPAFDIIKNHTDFQSFGILPYIDKASLLPEEDSVILDDDYYIKSGKKISIKHQKDHRKNIENTDKFYDKPFNRIKLAILQLSTISNFDDFDPLLAEAALDIIWVKRGEFIPSDCELIILPGNKTTISSLRELKTYGFDIDIKAHLRRGGKIMGICAGFQMMGRKVTDKYNIEGDRGDEDGLSLFDMSTQLSNHKSLEEVRGKNYVGADFDGYKMHMGVSEINDGQAQAFLKLDDGRVDGLISEDRHIIGTYIHGIFNNDEFRNWFLNWLCAKQVSSLNYRKEIDDTLDHLASQMEHHLNLRGLIESSK